MSTNHARAAAAYDPRYERLLNAIQYGAEKDAISLFSSEPQLYCVNLEIDYVFEDRMMYKVTPLNWAVRFNKPALCRFLLTQGARPFHNLVYEYYPLHEACCRGFESIVSIFIEFKCDLNVPTPNERETALHIACVRGNVGCVHLLLKSNANPHIRNAAGHTPLEAAVYNSQDDLVKLFSAYGISKSPTSSNTITHPSTLTVHHSHPPLQRRHSVHSPTNTVQKLLASVRPNSRPSSVLIVDHQTSYDTKRNNAVFPSSSVKSPPKMRSLTCSDSSTPLLRTTAPSTAGLSPLATSTQADIGCSDFLRPTYISQLSVASPSLANSPSPVEKDCSQKSWSPELRSQSISTSNYYSFPSKLTATSDTKIGAPCKHHVTTSPLSKDCGQYNRSVMSKTSPGIESTQPAHGHSQLSGHRRPQKWPLQDSCGGQTISAKEVTTSNGLDCKAQLQAKRSISPEKRSKTLTIPQATVSGSCSAPSPSRERIDLFAHCLLNALDNTHSRQDASSSIIQKLSEDVAKAVNLTREQLCSLVQLALSSARPVHNTPPNMLLEAPHLSTTAADHPAESLREMGLNIEDHPRDVRMSDPIEGYMSVLFSLRSSPNGATCDSFGNSWKTKNSAVKVIARVFNLRDPMESNQYHSIDSEQLICTDPDMDHLNEVVIMSKLSPFPYPGLAQLMSHFKADVFNQYERFARQWRPHSHEELYVTGKIADFLVLSMPSKTLGRHFEELKSSTFGGASERNVLAILSQLLLATAHLSRHKITHTALVAENIFVDTNNHDTVVIAHFGNALSWDSISAASIKSLKQRLESKIVCYENLCRVSPEVKEVLQAQVSNFEESCPIDNFPSLLEKSDSYAVARLMYELILGPNHKFIREIGGTCHSYDHIPSTKGLSPLSNHLLKSLLSYDADNRLGSLEGAIASLVLLFGPAPSQIKSLKDCKDWLLVKSVSFYLCPSLKDDSTSDYSDSLAKLQCMYLVLANTNPSLVFNACVFFQEQEELLN